MAMRLACEREDVIAAIWDLAGAGPSSTDTACSLSTPVAFAHAHGTGDTTISPAGGTFPGMAHPYISTASTLLKLATANGCGGSMSLVTSGYANFDSAAGASGNETSLNRQSACSGHADVTWYEMTGSMHVPTFVLPAWADEIWAYTNAHPKP